jgi:hypothetical protein
VNGSCHAELLRSNLDSSRLKVAVAAFFKLNEVSKSRSASLVQRGRYLPRSNTGGKADQVGLDVDTVVVKQIMLNGISVLLAASRLLLCFTSC